MSSDSFQAFMAKVQDDEDLKQALAEATGENGIPAETLATIAAGQGYEFTVEDMDSELDDAALDAVAGGLGRTLARLPFAKFDKYMAPTGALFVKISY